MMRKADPAGLPALNWEVEMPGYERIVTLEMAWEDEEALYQALFVRRSIRQNARLAAVRSRQARKARPVGAARTPQRP